MMFFLQKNLVASNFCIFLRSLPIFLTLFLSRQSDALLVEQLPNYKIIDQDLLSRGNLALVNQQHIDYQYQTITSQGKAYRLGLLSKNSDSNTPVFVVLHDSEDAAFDSGLETVAVNGGQLWVLENQENRNLYDYASQQLTYHDPNRMFWRLVEKDFPLNAKPSNSEQIDSEQTNIEQSASEPAIKLNANAEFANYLLEQLGVKNTLKQSMPSILIALHNNSPKGNFGVDYIDEFGNTQVVCSHDTEAKNLFWLATASHQDNTAKVNQRSNALQQKLCKMDTVNVVTENAPSVIDGDGSLSIYMVNHFPYWQYVNIEIKAGKKGDIPDETRAKHAQLHYIQRLKSALYQ